MKNHKIVPGSDWRYSDLGEGLKRYKLRQIAIKIH